ncbi:MAG: septum formation initiator family protein [Patescibacteria group bacterium]
MKKAQRHNFGKKKKGAISLFSSKIFFFLLILVLSGLIRVGYDKFREWSFAKKSLASQEEKIEQAKRRRSDLKNLLNYLQSEGYLIRTVKEKLNLVAPGEKIIFVVPEEDKEELKIEAKNDNFFTTFFRAIKEKFFSK